jgi:rhodanese-related sulfurtransferase
VERLAVARRLAGEAGRWRELVLTGLEEDRIAVRLVGEETYEAWLIGWPPGHRTSPHDHGGSTAAIVVVEGVLEEVTFGADAPTSRRLEAGAPSGVTLEREVVHDVGNPASVPAVSVHVYSPPLSAMTFYDESGLPEAVLAVAEERPVAESRALALDLHPSSTSSVDLSLASAREGLDRIRPADLEAVAASGALLVDVRPQSDRVLDGDLPGAVIVERIHLEWRLDPTSPHRLKEAVPGRRVVVVCNEGYASTLAARALRDLGVDATDLEGGYRAWKALRQ